MDLFIEKALIFNGVGNPPFEANIGIKKDKIVYIGREKYSARRVIKANGLILTQVLLIPTHTRILQLLQTLKQRERLLRVSLLK